MVNWAQAGRIGRRALDLGAFAGRADRRPLRRRRVQKRPVGRRGTGRDVRLTQQELADRARLDRKTIVRLETGRQRPTTASIWKIARALRVDLRSRVALDERVRASTGESLRDYGRRPHAARERMRLALRLEAGDGLPAADDDTSLGAQIVAALAVLANIGTRPDSGR